jgi:hypothetical protein
MTIGGAHGAMAQTAPATPVVTLSVPTAPPPPPPVVVGTDHEPVAASRPWRDAEAFEDGRTPGRAHWHEGKHKGWDHDDHVRTFHDHDDHVRHFGDHDDTITLGNGGVVSSSHYSHHDQDGRSFASHHANHYANHYEGHTSGITTASGHGGQFAAASSGHAFSGQTSGSHSTSGHAFTQTASRAPAPPSSR